MIARFRSWQARRASLRAAADALVARHGEEASAIARGAAIEAARTGDGRNEWRVSALVDRRLGIVRQADTATRYLEGR